MCKEKFTQLLRFNEVEGSKEPEIIERIEVAPKSQVWEPAEFDFITEYADVCYECGVDDEEEKLMICDTCDYKICHYYCDGLVKLPPDDQAWFCKFCLQKDKELKEYREE